jgi:hypothetical protein
MRMEWKSGGRRNGDNISEHTEEKNHRVCVREHEEKEREK